MTIEQEFFEAFGIGKIDGHKCIPHNTIENKCEHVISGFTDCCSNCEHLEKKYPPITPEIVLGLEDIIIEKFGDIYWDKKGVHKDGYKMYRCKCTLQSNEISAMWAVGKTKKDTLIDLCRYLKNDGMQDQVKALFNA